MRDVTKTAPGEESMLPFPELGTTCVIALKLGTTLPSAGVHGYRFCMNPAKGGISAVLLRSSLVGTPHKGLPSEEEIPSITVNGV
jgi:hypothetical protein